ncbi:aspartic peptidase A1 [Mycena floridula]|nr:aspartic peptidase A1 [Mycena floridula]
MSAGSFWTLSLGLAALIASDVFANPTPSPSRLSMDLRRRSSRSRTPDEWALWAKGHKDMLTSKYGGTGKSVPNEKRSSGTNLMVNQNYDSSFYGSLAIGTPAVSYNVILDTGSADLWIADSSCQSGCDGIQTFDSSASSTFATQNKNFGITYGSGAASGQLGTDTVQMAGFSVSAQVLALCDTVSSGLLTSPVSGLLGLAFSTISSSGATPFWENLVQSGAWDTPAMAFQLTRYIDDEQAQELEPGGSFTMGFLNSSFYTGDVDYNSIPDGKTSYWTQTISSITVQGSSITLSSDSDAYAAIDTGTTLVGGPATDIAAIYAQIPGSAAGTGNYDGYYTYPCDTTVDVTMAFGGKSWSISSADFLLAQLNKDTCLGAFFELATGSSAPSWIVGDTFLKNVYSVFRYNPAAVGFAQLSDYALSLNGDNNAKVPTATIGSVAAAVAATAGTRESSSAARNLISETAMCMAILLVSLLL